MLETRDFYKSLNTEGVKNSRTFDRIAEDILNNKQTFKAWS